MPFSDSDVKYVMTLNEFYEHSNENEVDGFNIAKLVYKFFTSRSAVTWLDVGCGPGIKLDIIAKHFAEWDGPIIRLSGIDPCEYWLSSLESRFNEHSKHIQLVETINDTWECFSMNKIEGKYDIISFIHSLYGLTVDDELIPSFGHASSFITDDGIMIVVVESPKSDLYCIKKELFGKVLDFPLVDFSIAENTFQYYLFNWKLISDVDQKYYLGNSIDEALSNINALSFIVQTKPESYNYIINSVEKEAIKSSVKKRLKKDENGLYLSIPDRIYIIRKPS